MRAFCDRAGKSELVRAAAWMISGHGVAILFQAWYFILIGRALGSHEYGAFAGVVSLVGVLSQFSAFGQEMLLVRDTSRDPAQFPIAWGRALAASAIGFLLLMAVALLAARALLAPGLQLLVPVIALSDGFFGKLTTLAYRAFQGAGRMADSARLLALINGSRALAAGILMCLGRIHGFHPSAYSWAKTYCFASAAVALFSILKVHRRLGKPGFSRPDWNVIREGLGFSLSNSSISIYNDIDKTVLVSSGQLGAAGIYSAAYRVIDVASAPLYSIYAAAAPRIFREGAAGSVAASRLPKKMLPVLVAYALAVAICLVAGAPVLPMLFGPSFRGSVAALRWLCLLPLLRALHYSWGTAITGAASQWYRTATQSAAALLNLLLDLILIPHGSWRGAAVASLATDGSLALISWAVLAHLKHRERRIVAAAAA